MKILRGKRAQEKSERFLQNRSEAGSLKVREGAVVCTLNV
jgi:hypothetical protein